MENSHDDHVCDLCASVCTQRFSIVFTLNSVWTTKTIKKRFSADGKRFQNGEENVEFSKSNGLVWT